MDELLFLVFLSATIGFGSYFAGCIPMMVSLSEVSHLPVHLW